MGTAKKIRALDDGSWNGDAALYQLDPPIDNGEDTISFVIVSAVVAMFSGPETYIFPATDAGQVIDYGELEGSFRGALDHERALENAGYRLAEAR